MFKTVYVLVTDSESPEHQRLIAGLSTLEEELPGELMISDSIRIDAVSMRACELLDGFLEAARAEAML